MVSKKNSSFRIFFPVLCRNISFMLDKTFFEKKKCLQKFVNDAFNVVVAEFSIQKKIKNDEKVSSKLEIFVAFIW